jgi:hypothetical protein
MEEWANYHFAGLGTDAGVRVRGFETSDLESLFDYNLNDLSIDEARKASDWDVRHHCGQALAAAGKDELAALFERLRYSDKPVWEFTFDKYSLSPQWDTTYEAHERKKRNWQEAFDRVAGEKGALTSKDKAGHLQRKGYETVEAPDALVDAASQWGVRTPAKVLNPDEQMGYEIGEPTPDAQEAVDQVWALLEGVGLTRDKGEAPGQVLHVHPGRGHDAERVLSRRRRVHQPPPGG